jgi:hypothetical protein
MSRVFENRNWTRMCPTCEEIFRPVTKAQVYCEPACKQAQYRLRKKRRAAKAKAREGLSGRPT